MTRITPALDTDHTPHKRRQAFAYIDTRGAKPRIKGRRITVANVAIWHIWQGDAVQRIAENYQLTLAQAPRAKTSHRTRGPVIRRLKTDAFSS